MKPVIEKRTYLNDHVDNKVSDNKMNDNKVNVTDLNNSIDIPQQIQSEVAQNINYENKVSYDNMDKVYQNKDTKNYNTDLNSQRNTYEDDSDIDVFDKTTANSVTKTVRAFKSMQDVFAPPADPIRNAMENAVSQMATRFAENLLVPNQPTAITKPSIIKDLMNTAFGHGLGETVGNQLPHVIKSLSGAIGEKKTNELVDNINSRISHNENNSNDSSNTENQKDMVLSLDENNPEHVMKYASAMGLTEKAAKGVLQIHKDDILTERGSNNKNISNDVSEALSILVKEVVGMKDTINSLQTELSVIKGNKVNDKVIEDDRWLDDRNVQNNVNKNVTLFESPISVDVDEINTDNNPFFKETNKINSIDVKSKLINNQQKHINKDINESVLEEVVDNEGNSSFRMSNENVDNNIKSEKIEDIEDIENIEEIEEIKNIEETENIEETVQKNNNIKPDEKQDEKSEIKKKVIIKKITKKVDSEKLNLNKDSIETNFIKG